MVIHDRIVKNPKGKLIVETTEKKDYEKPVIAEEKADKEPAKKSAKNKG